MSSYVKQVGEEKYFCIDDYFRHREYGFVKMTEEEKNSESPWELLDGKSLEGRGGNREVLRHIPVEIHETNPDNDLGIIHDFAIIDEGLEYDPRYDDSDMSGSSNEDR